MRKALDDVVIFVPVPHVVVLHKFHAVHYRHLFVDLYQPNIVINSADSATMFMSQDADDYETRRSLVETLLREQGEMLVTSLLNACLFSLPSYLLVDSSEVIFALMLLDRPVSL